jgi:hypothetical protein
LPKQNLTLKIRMDADFKQGVRTGLVCQSISVRSTATTR